MNTRVRRIIVGLCVADVLLIAALGILIAGPFAHGTGGEPSSGKAAETQESAERADLARRVRLLTERNAQLETELGQARVEIAELRTAASPSPGAGLPSAGKGDPDVKTPESAAGADLGEAKKRKPTFESLAAKLLKLVSLAPKEGEPPTPELMKAVGELMSEVSKLQADLGLEDPGYVTEAPAFKAKCVAKALEQAGFPLDQASISSLDASAAKAMEGYLADAKAREGDFALSRTSRLLKDIEDFDDELSRLVDLKKLADSPVFGSKGEEDASAEGSKWPSQSSVGVKDLEEAVEKIAKRWKSAMGIPDSGSALLEAVVRDFVQRSDSAAQRTAGPGGTGLDPRQRRDLDHEIAGHQVEALRRLYDAFGADETVGGRIRSYNCLERFEPGGTGSWMRSGSFGGFKVQSSTRKSPGDGAQDR